MLKRSSLHVSKGVPDTGTAFHEEALDYLLRRNAFASRPEGNPAVVLLDLKLPKVNGLEVLEVIRSIDELRTIPVAMLTGSKMECDVEKAYWVRGECLRRQAARV